MKQAFWFYILLFFAGIAIVALPDDGEPVFILSENHGPSVVDFTGVILILWTWTAMLAHAFRRWRQILHALGGPLLAALMVITLAAYLTLAVSVRSDSPSWIFGALLAFAGQMVPITVAFRQDRHR
jgi:hypothetical protein